MEFDNLIYFDVVARALLARKPELRAKHGAHVAVLSEYARNVFKQSKPRTKRKGSVA